MTTKLLERLVTKFSIKVNDFAKYLGISKATVYNYRNLEKFADIPQEKRYKIMYLFGKQTEEELELLLDESDQEILARYVNRINGILEAAVRNDCNDISSVEGLTLQVEKLQKEILSLQSQLVIIKKLDGLDDFTKTILIDKIAGIVEGCSVAEIKEFMDYLEIFEKYKQATRG